MQQITNADIDQFMFDYEAGKYEAQFIRSFKDCKDEIYQRLQGCNYGERLPWESSFDKFTLRPQEVSIFAGCNGGGKSLLTGQIASWAARKSKILIASLEMPLGSTAARMVRQCSGASEPSRKFADRWADWTDERIWVYDQTRSVNTERIVAMIHFAAEGLGVNHVIIDNLSKCGIDQHKEGFKSQQKFVDDLGWVAKTLNIHIILVHHMRKPDDMRHRANKYDVKGSGAITDLADNVVLVDRNTLKEDKKRTKSPKYDENEADTYLTVAKQRHGEWEGVIPLWFDPKSLQFVSRPKAKAMPWPSQKEQILFMEGDDGF